MNNHKKILSIFLFGGVDVPNFELKLSQIDQFVRKLRKIYKVNPEWFDVPAKLKLIH